MENPLQTLRDVVEHGSPEVAIAAITDFYNLHLDAGSIYAWTAKRIFWGLSPDQQAYWGPKIFQKGNADAARSRRSYWYRKMLTACIAEPSDRIARGKGLFSELLPPRLPDRACRYCMKVFVPHCGKHVYCSDRCGQRYRDHCPPVEARNA